MAKLVEASVVIVDPDGVASVVLVDFAQVLLEYGVPVLFVGDGAVGSNWFSCLPLREDLARFLLAPPPLPGEDGVALVMPLPVDEAEPVLEHGVRALLLLIEGAVGRAVHGLPLPEDLPGLLLAPLSIPGPGRVAILVPPLVDVAEAVPEHVVRALLLGDDCPGAEGPPTPPPPG